MISILKRCATLGLLLALILAVGMAETKAQNGWKRVQNGAQGYVLDCPRSATARRYDPEGILHIVLQSEGQPHMMVRAHNALAPLSTGESITGSAAQALAQAVLDELGTPTRPGELRPISIGGTTAIATDLPGIFRYYRLIVWQTTEHVYSIIYPLGETGSEAIFAQVLQSIRPTESKGDQGLEVHRADTSVIANLPVPVYYQNDNQWRCDQIGSCTAYGGCYDYKWACNELPTILTIGDVGCTISSYAMIFEYFTPAHYMTPLELDTCYTTYGEYGDFAGCGLCGRYWSNLNYSNCKPGDVTYIGETYDPGVLDADLAAGYPLMGELPGHYVVVIGKSGADYRVNNPVISGRTTYAFSEFSTFVRFRGPLPGGCHCCYKLGGSKTVAWDSFTQSAASLKPVAVVAPELVTPPELVPVVTFEPQMPSEPLVEKALEVRVREPAPWLAPPPAEEPAAVVAHAPVDPLRVPPGSAHFVIPKAVFGSGGGPKASTNYRMNGTQGQTTALNLRQSANYILAPGYWAQYTSVPFDYGVYLPLVLRNY